jgi:hypothetical protein
VPDDQQQEQAQQQLQGRLAEVEKERDALKADLDRLTQEGKERLENALKLAGERDAFKAKTEELESAIRDGQNWAARPPLPFERQPPLHMPAWTMDHRFYALGAVLTRDQVRRGM